MRKIIHKIGDSLGVIFNKEEQSIYNLYKGSTVEINIRKIGGR